MANIRARFCALLTLTVAIAISGCAPTPDGPRPGDPPASGPGSTPAAPADVRITQAGDGAQAVFIYEPIGVDAAGAPLATAPVVVFLHGYSGTNPLVYGAWIKHLVQRGNIVIYPVYQDSLIHPSLYTGDALAAILNAYDILRHGDHVRPDDAKLALVGHSLGGVIAMNIAAIAHAQGLPRVAALLAANAGDTTSQNPNYQSIQADNYNEVPADMLFLGVVGEDDDYVGMKIVFQLYDALPQVPSANREVVELFTNDFGQPPLVADHHDPLAFDRDFDSGGPLALSPEGRFFTGNDLPRDRLAIDNHDYYGYWKWLDALLDAAFRGENREFALGGGAEQLDQGTWQDGTPARPAARILPDPPAN